MGTPPNWLNAAVWTWMVVCMTGALVSALILWAFPPGDAWGEYALRGLTAAGVFAVAVAQMVLTMARDQARREAEASKKP